VLQVHYLEIWLVPQSVDLSPKEGYTASNLDKTHLGYKIVKGTLCSSFWSLHQQNLFRFIEIGDIAIFVYTSPEITGTGSMS
jgi:hypothetical protein